MRVAAFLMLGSLVLAVPWSRAGLYNPADLGRRTDPSFEAGAALSYHEFEELLGTQLSVNNTASNEYEKLTSRREELLKVGQPSVDQVLELSYCQIRLRRYEDAIRVLSPLTRQRDNFMVFANIATAQQLVGRFEEAYSSLGQAIDAWPSSWPGLSQERLAWYRKVETYHRRLMRIQLIEERTGKGRSRPQGLYPLFPVTGDDPVHFVGDSGEYEVGAIAAKERSKLPSDCMAITQQLVLWLPDDTRLYWLLGELYNAEGDPVTAGKIFQQCVYSRRFDSPELKAHRQIVQEYKPKSQPLELVTETPAQNNELVSGWLPDTGKLIVVGGAAGIFVFLLLYLQVREFRRRRKAP
jgi:tetratricopeptide (TPR) repeat protein